MTLPHPAMAHGGPPPGLAGPGLPRLLPGTGTVPVDLRGHLAMHGPLRTPGGRDGLLREVAAAGLTGRGGAAFPVARKLAAAAEARPAPVVVGNGAEGEPASSKDRSLLWISPHLVLDGLQLAAGAAGSRSAVLYVPRNERLHGRLAGAIAERAAAGMDAARVELVTAPDRFLAGEESALVSRLAGRPALPAYRPVRGLPRLAPGRPALVQNVETLAHLALIGRYGAAWFREAGTEAEPGTMLATLHLADGRTSVAEVPLGTGLGGLLGLEARPGPAEPGTAVAEVPLGTGLAGLLGLEARPGPAGPGTTVAEVPLGTGLAGLLGLEARPGPAEAGAAGPGVPSAFGQVQAVLAGGYHGAWLPAAEAAALPLANAALRPLGAVVGAGVLAALPADRCGLAETARVARYLALESAGQCGPCFNGLPRIAAAVAHLAGPRPDARARADLERWAGLVAGRGACHHPDGSVRFIRSALRVFAAEAGLHEQGRCSGTDPRPFLPVPAASPATDEDWS